MRILLPLLLLVLGGCHVPAREGDPSLPNQPVPSEFFKPPTPTGRVRLRIATIAGARIPERALAASVATVERHLGSPIEVIREEPWDIAEPDDPAYEIAAMFPIRENGRLLTEADLKPGPGEKPEYRLAQPDNGITGAIGVPTATDPTSGIFWHHLVPIVEPGVILVVVAPGTKSGGGHTGYTTFVGRSEAPGKMKKAMVVLRQRAIERHANLFVSADKLWEWTLTHEIGHILGIPSSNSHQWIVPGYGGAHCTRPECIMYTGLDWRVVVSGLLHGWPLDYCGLCSAELAVAREKAGVAAPVRPASSAPPIVAGQD